MDTSSSIDPRYWRRLRRPPDAIQEMRGIPVERRLNGLRGMSWSAAAVIYSRRTASWLSGLALRARMEVDDAPGNFRPSANSKIMNQYLRGERAPLRGPRGKWGFDLTGAVDAIPGGAIARLYLESPIWELLDDAIPLERIQAILTSTGLDHSNMPMRTYIKAWAQYRLSIAEHHAISQQQHWANEIAALQEDLRWTDPVFGYLYGPLIHFLAIREPGIPFKHRESTKHASKFQRALDAGFTRFEGIGNRFEDGTDRFVMSGRLPDRRFLRQFRNRWDIFLFKWKIIKEVEADLRASPQVPVSRIRGAPVPDSKPDLGWQALYGAWGVRIPEDCLFRRQSVQFP